jgi:hypothetical protein
MPPASRLVFRRIASRMTVVPGRSGGTGISTERGCPAKSGNDRDPTADLPRGQLPGLPGPSRFSRVGRRCVAAAGSRPGRPIGERSSERERDRDLCRDIGLIQWR